jgi:hypothetical protein
LETNDSGDSEASVETESKRISSFTKKKKKKKKKKHKLLEDLSSITLLKVKNGGYRSWLTAETRTSMT